MSRTGHVQDGGGIPADEPAVKAQSVKLILERIRSVPEGEAILARIEPGIVREVDQATNTQWLRLDHAWPLNRAVWAELGDDRFRQFQLEHTLAAVETPVFGALIKGLLNLFGARPGGMLKHAARGWSAAMRNCGTVEGREIGPGHAEVIMGGLPDILTRDLSYSVSNEGSLQIVFELTRTPGEVIPDASRRVEGVLRYDLRWPPAG